MLLQLCFLSFRLPLRTLPIRSGQTMTMVSFLRAAIRLCRCAFDLDRCAWNASGEPASSNGKIAALQRMSASCTSAQYV
ncbi:MAG TPA: hypothetical protein VKX46_15345 [Ktedonobacteraceae bacterium]|nr:hypothetical protein [Ktedonobacteraceae bacterium]